MMVEPEREVPVQRANWGFGTLHHNLIRWTAMLGEITPEEHLVVARTVRTRFLSIPGRLVSPGGRPILRAPLEWPWAKAFERTLDLLRALPPVPG